jgi:glycolate oxidase
MPQQNTFNRVTDDIILALRLIVGENNVLTGQAREGYAKDETPNFTPVLPDVVVRPENSTSVAQVLKLANEKRIPVTPRGAGTGLSAGAVAVSGGIVMSMERMNHIIEIDVANFTATIEPGVILSSLCQEVEKHGLYYPIYPGEMSATLGGNVATNAGGMRAVKYGVTRNFLLGLEVVLPTGDIIETGGKYIKCSTGYDLSQLIAGSEGTLGIITKIILRLMTPPGRRDVVLVPFDNLEDAINAVPHILKEGILPIGIEFLEKDVVRLTEVFRGSETPLHNYEASLMIILETGTDKESSDLSTRVGEICLEHNAIDVFVASGERATDLMSFREKAWPAIVHSGNADIADVVVPRSKIAEFVKSAREISRKLGITTYAVGHAGDGNVHLAPMVPEGTDAQERITQFFRQVFELGVSMGGTISGEHGIGSDKKQFIDIAVSKEKLGLLKRIKKAFDPNGIMNPGKIFDL